jgi:uncharacterized UPF0160 family protein
MNIQITFRDILYCIIGYIVIYLITSEIYKYCTKTTIESYNNVSSEEYIDELYKNAISPYVVSTDERKQVEDLGKSISGATYGYIKYDSLKDILNYLKVDESDVFYDLGSGSGRVVVQTALDSKAKKCIGIELSKTRHDTSIDTTKDVKKLTNKIQFRNENILTADISDATIIYMCSTCFSPELLNGVVDNIKKCKHKVKIASLKSIKNDILKYKDTIQINTSWAPKIPCYIYEYN